MEVGCYRPSVGASSLLSARPRAPSQLLCAATTTVGPLFLVPVPHWLFPKCSLHSHRAEEEMRWEEQKLPS